MLNLKEDNMIKVSQLIIMIFFIMSCGGTVKKKSRNNLSVKPITETDKIFYAMGAMMGSRLRRIDLDNNEISMIQQGLKDSVKEAPLEVSFSLYREKIQRLVKLRMQGTSKSEKEKGEQYLVLFADPFLTSLSYIQSRI